ncbi:MAG: pyridoxal 5'-phosphate synthase glutaminase subunit PdxT [Armatimonadetes bacterium]|nr:pyridoxal 5'-phosphate synthase glutaminase subunit PdxT [Armatimonadota bacterium]
MRDRVGVLALQGDYQKHLDVLSAIGAFGTEVRTPGELATCSRLIIPGGESTTLGILLTSSGLDKAIVSRAGEGTPIWGTCMGMILMAKEVEGYKQFLFGILDVTVRRNAFGAQIFSFEEGLEFSGFASPLHAVFIRAPIVTRMGSGVEALARIDDQIVAVRQGSLLGTSFHPELTGDTRLHEMFLRF